MKTFIFIQKNGNALIALSAVDYEQALLTLENTVLLPDSNWRCEDEKGEDEEE